MDIFIVCIALVFFMLVLTIKAGKDFSYVSNIEKQHYIALALLLAASVLTWAALIFISSEDGSFEVGWREKVGLAFSLILGFATWGRLVYTIDSD